MAFTFFFRDLHTLKLIEKHVVPKITNRRYLDIWDAGCAHGPEAYSLAIILRDNMGPFMFRNVRIFATDINGQFGDIIKRGAYPEEQVKRIPAEILQKYYSPADTPGDFQVSEELRKAVWFRQHDLTSLQPIRSGLCLIVCKNVLLHLSPEERVNVMKMFSDSLCEGGFLVTEQTQKMPDELKDRFVQIAPDGQIFQRIGSPVSDERANSSSNLAYH